MTTTRVDNPLHRAGVGRFLALAGAWFAAAASAAWAGDLYSLVPADVPAVILFPNYERGAERARAFLHRISPDIDTRVLDHLGIGMHLDRGTWDQSRPLAIILSRPVFAQSSVVVAYTPSNERAVLQQLGGRRNVIRRCNDGNGPYYMMLKSGVTFASDKRKSLWAVRRREAFRSLADAWDEQEKQRLADSDVIVRFSMDRWREILSPYMTIITNMINLTTAAGSSQDRPAARPAAMKCLLDSFNAFFHQMETVTLALSIGDDAVRLTHGHQFCPDKSIARYLSKVKHSGTKLLDSVPDRPFLMLALVDWKSPAGESLSASIVRAVFKAEGGPTGLSAEDFKKVISEMNAYHDQMRGYSMMFTAPEGRLVPFQILGAYHVRNADEGLSQVCFIQSRAGDCLAGFIPSSSFRGTFKTLKCQGLKCFEMTFDPKGLGEQAEAELKRIYGANVRFQNAAIAPDEIGYCMAEPPMSVAAIVDAKKSGRVMAHNAELKQVLGLAKGRPHAIVVLDLGRALALVPEMAQMKLGGADESPATARTYRGPPGPYLGWCCTVHPSSVQGELFIRPDDAAAAFHLARSMGRQMTRYATSAPSEPAP